MIQLNKIDKPHKIYIDSVEDGALDQFINAMNDKHTVRGALMPDTHQGYTLPIGAVIETKGWVSPAYCGYDLGCGVCALPLNVSASDISFKAEKIQKQILRNIPVGFNKHSSPVPSLGFDLGECTDVMKDIYNQKQGDLQLGTLGGGNHFIEIGVDDDNQVWVIIHSGSRGVGHGCATHYMKKASPTGKASEGCYGFDVEYQDGVDYIKDMFFCLEYALKNREIMLSLVIDSIRQLGIECSGEWDQMINRNHNHATSTDGVHWIHRKGATHAEKGMMGVIPGNMRDGSFIVKGLGNEDALCSSSHGAGRVLGRRKAKETLDIEEFGMEMEGIVANVDTGTLDESPMAYKDIFEVMRLQEGLVETITHVKPILNVKG